MTFTVQCPECKAHFSAWDQASANSLRDAHVKDQHVAKVDSRTLAYIEVLETSVQTLQAENQKLKSKKERKRKEK